MDKKLETFLKGQIDYYNKRIIGCDGDDGNEEDLLIWKTKIETYEEIIKFKEDKQLIEKKWNELRNNIFHELSKHPTLTIEKFSRTAIGLELCLDEKGEEGVNNIFVSNLVKSHPNLKFSFQSYLTLGYDFKYLFMINKD